MQTSIGSAGSLRRMPSKLERKPHVHPSSSTARISSGATPTSSNADMPPPWQPCRAASGGSQ